MDLKAEASRRPDAHQLTDQEMVCFLNSHHPGKSFTAFTVFDKRGLHGYIQVILVDNTIPNNGLKRLPKGYEFDVKSSRIIPSDENKDWPDFIVLSQKSPTGFLASLLLKVIHRLNPALV